MERISIVVVPADTGAREMPLDKEYYPLAEAAALLKCKINDFIFYGARNYIEICVYLDLENEYIEEFFYSDYSGMGHKGFFSLDTDDLYRFEASHDKETVNLGIVYPYKPKGDGRDWHIFSHTETTNLVIFAGDLERMKKFDNGKFMGSTTIMCEENPKSIESLLKIVITMAKDGYGYDHTAKKNGLPREISEAAELLGLTITDDSVRKWLKKGAELLPRGED